MGLIQILPNYCPINDWGRISVGLCEHLYAREIVSLLNQPRVCLNSQVITMDICSEAALKLPRSLVQCSYAYHLFLMSILDALNSHHNPSIVTSESTVAILDL